MASPQNTHIPARKPAIVPQPTSALGAHSSGQVDGGSPRNIPRFAAMIRERTKAHPKIFPELPFLSSSIVSLFSVIHAFPKSAGEYHTPPNTNAEMPATRTASQL